MNKKKILVISPQYWHFLFISKQHYALALSDRYDVYYLTFPEKKMGTGVSVEKDAYSGKVNIIKYQVPLPHRLLFRATRLYKWVNRRVVKKMLHRITGGQPFELVIDFGLFFLYDDLAWIDARKKIFFPVDDSATLPVSYKGADLVLSVSENVIAKFRSNNIPAQFIHHGLSGEYAAYAQKRLQQLSPEHYEGEKIKAVGYIGNMDNEFVDRNLLLQLMSAFPQCRFHCYGLMPNAGKQQNDPFWQKITNLPNVVFHGQQSPRELAEKIQDMDALLLCYQPDYKRYHAENSHKIMEYLSTGKPVVSTYISAFKDTGLLYMSPKDRNEQLVDVFRQVMTNPETSNTLAEKRIRFALEHTYAKHTEQILQWTGLATDDHS